MKFGGIGVPELLIILAVILLIFGPKNLPKLGSALGKTVKNLREGMGGVGDEEPEDGEEEAEEAVEEEPAPQKKAAKKKAE
jgi:sec-independent protein translocase protein TatA